MTHGTVEKRALSDRFLSGLEAAGNKLPQPFNLFLWLFGIVGVVGTIAAWAGVSVQVPGAEEVTPVRGLFTGEGLAWFTANLGPNYLGFPPLVTVLPILLAIGIAEKTGFLSAAIRAAIGSAPRWLLPYMVGFLGVVGSIMADSVFVILPPLAALAFAAVGRHPVAGLLGGFAAAGAGYSTSIFPTSLDALFAGITNAVLPTVPTVEAAAAPVNPVSNYYFNIVAALLLSLIAGFIIDKVIEPRLVRTGVPTTPQASDPGAPTTHTIDDEGNEVVVDTAAEVNHALTADERRGLVMGGLAVLGVGVVMLAATLVPFSPWRNEAGGFLPRSPLLSSIVFIVFTLFAVGGYVYGRSARTIEGFNDVPRLMGLALKDMIPFLVLAFVMGQFIALFNWSGIGSWIAVAGADGLEATGLTGFGVIVLFILLCSLLNLFIISGSAMWTIMAAVFVPMFGLVGFEPAFVQAAFRIGDSATQVITPMNPYMIVLLTYLRRYTPQAGFGSLMSGMVPFVVPFWLGWLALLFVFYSLGLPLGPGNDIFIEELRR
ncbi:AbgT family transporter [Propioniciclava soli]|uniref:AbgT family transporter n=1 Tax=Propioniciclava soli TaxID=2775081 RepID=UPI001E4AF901|nr:AbgT family transporter [Propioniciclava soli]